jgi:eukaryotic-like serine/threonine-protein kinase
LLASSDAPCSFNPCLKIPEVLRNALKGRYDVERELGAGGMATVYLAQDVRHDRRVA